MRMCQTMSLHRDARGSGAAFSRILGLGLDHQVELIDGTLQRLQVEWADGGGGLQHHLDLPGKICTIGQAKGTQNPGKLVSRIRTRPPSIFVRRIGSQYAMGRAQYIQPLAYCFPAPRPKGRKQVVKLTGNLFRSGVRGTRICHESLLMYLSPTQSLRDLRRKRKWVERLEQNSRDTKFRKAALIGALNLGSEQNNRNLCSLRISLQVQEGRRTVHRRHHHIQ